MERRREGRYRKRRRGEKKELKYANQWEELQPSPSPSFLPSTRPAEVQLYFVDLCARFSKFAGGGGGTEKRWKYLGKGKEGAGGPLFSELWTRQSFPSLKIGKILTESSKVLFFRKSLSFSLTSTSALPFPSPQKLPTANFWGRAVRLGQASVSSV